MAGKSSAYSRGKKNARCHNFMRHLAIFIEKNFLHLILQRYATYYEDSKYYYRTNLRLRKKKSWTHRTYIGH